MTIREVYALRYQGRTDEAYEAIRQIYAADKSPYATACMFWTALSVLRLRLKAHQYDEAQRIYRALERVLAQMNDRDGKARQALDRLRLQLPGSAAEATQPGQQLAAHAQLGKWGEEMAAVYLRSKGYVILERDWRSSHRDIDIVAVDGNTLVFVEVKTRSNDDFAAPEEAVDQLKQRHLRLAINHYVKTHHVDQRWRFDVVAIVGSMGSMPEITHIENFVLNLR